MKLLVQCKSVFLDLYEVAQRTEHILSKNTLNYELVRLFHKSKGEINAKGLYIKDDIKVTKAGMLSVPIILGAVISSGIGTAVWYFTGSFLGTVGLSFPEALAQSTAIDAFRSYCRYLASTSSLGVCLLCNPAR